MAWWQTLKSIIPNDGLPLLVPEVVQTSMMDCGPASLKSLLQAYGINVSYARLREACQTDVDGTSIESLEDLAVRLGLDATQVMLPADHLLLPESAALPALAVVRQPSGLTHFIIIWRLHGDWVQIMDPAAGRQWFSRQGLLQRLYIHSQSVGMEELLAWASGPGFLEPLHSRLLEICPDPGWAEETIAFALQGQTWHGIAALDAAVRMANALQKGTQALRSPITAGQLVNQLQQQPDIIPPAYWSVKAHDDDPAQVLLQGAVIITISGQHEAGHDPESATDPAEGQHSPEETAPPPLPPETDTHLLASLSEPPPEPERHIWSLLRRDGLLSPTFVGAGIVIAGLGTALEILVMRGLMEINNQIQLVSQQMQVFSLVLLFMLSFLLLEWALTFSTLRMGRRLETRLRQEFLEKLPRLGDRYFRSRLTSDLIQRAHELHSLHSLPDTATRFIQYCAQLVFVTIGLMVIYPDGFLLILLCSALIIATSLLSRPLVEEQDMRFRTHTGSLGRFYLDALQGLLPIRSHGAEDALKTEHETHLVEWFKAGVSKFHAFERLLLLNILLETLISIWLVYSYLQSGGSSSGTLVLVYWLMMLPGLGLAVMESAQQYPSLRNQLLRILEPINTPDEGYQWYPGPGSSDAVDMPTEKQLAPPSPSTPTATDPTGMTIEFSAVDLTLSGRQILKGIHASLQAGEQVAIVGSSGAGKSTLAGLLLGWYGPASGTVKVDGHLLQDTWLHQCREQTAWIDPDIQLWNRSLRENIQYGQAVPRALDTDLLARADLLEIIHQLPEGEETVLGEGGKRLSGGEGQRVRLGRAMRHETPRLVVMDEPFRGLTRDQRSLLLGRAREHWQGSTLLFISHDIQDTLGFDRVWVIEDGELVEDGQPYALSQQAGSRYAMLLDTERSIRNTLWASTRWTRFRLGNGNLTVTPARSPENGEQT